MTIDDQAEERSQQFLAVALAVRKPEGPTTTGTCHNCGEETPGRRWCDARCRDDWERRNA